MRRVLEIRTDTGKLICSRCLVADTVFSRMRGLLGRKQLGDDESMLISPSNNIHTHFMRFAIDVVFLDRGLTVLATRERLRPWRMAACRKARSVLELPAGACNRWGLQPGDRLELVDRAEGSTQVLLVLHHADGPLVLGRGPLAAASRTISALNELEGRVSAVLVPDEEAASS